MITSRVPVVLAVIFCTTGILFGFWPLAAFAIAIAALTRHFFVALIIGLLCDILYGVPPGTLHFSFFPFTVFAALLNAIAALATRYFFDHEESRV